MRIVRIRHKGRQCWGVLSGKLIRLLKGAPFAALRFSGRSIAYHEAMLLAPSLPSKVVLVGLNYYDHARELRMKTPSQPVLFLKPPTAIIGPGENIVYPPEAGRVDYEAELALVVKKKARNITPESAQDYILGYTCLNDVTARDLQQKDGQWTRAKSFDTFCPVGPWIKTGIDPLNLTVSAWLNGALKQSSSTAEFIFPLTYIVSFISRVMTLLPGDIISTGTPPGVGPMQKGDRVRVQIKGIGSLENKIV